MQPFRAYQANLTSRTKIPDTKVCVGDYCSTQDERERELPPFVVSSYNRRYSMLGAVLFQALPEILAEDLSNLPGLPIYQRIAHCTQFTQKSELDIKG